MSFFSLLGSAIQGSLLDPEFLYTAMGAFSLGGVLLATTVVARGRSTRELGGLASYLARMRVAVPAVLLLAAVTFLVGLEGGVDQAINAALGWDFTPLMFRWEGHAVEAVQDALRVGWLDWPMVIVYTMGAFAVYHVPFASLVLRCRGRSAMRVAATLAIVWCVALVFYAFFPVNEPWTTAHAPYGWTHVQNVLFEKIPAARTSEAYQHAINNEFPSLHVAATSAIAFSLLLAGERRMGVACAIIAAGIAIATMYLGIHWVSDVVGGLLLAASAAWIVHRQLPTESAPTRPHASLTDGAEPT